jgi:double-strand break repair protein MRE11
MQRVDRATKNFISDVMLDDFLDFVVWGHEHECLVAEQQSLNGHFYITQPGSSIATSLSLGEAKDKHVALLRIDENNRHQCSGIPLKTVRPFIIDSIDLTQTAINPVDTKQVVATLEKKVNEMITEASAKRTPQNANLLPLIRLRVDYSGGFEGISPQRFGQAFVGKVANPSEILLLTRSRVVRSTTLSHCRTTHS